jgi:hypothetical protein
VWTARGAFNAWHLASPSAATHLTTTALLLLEQEAAAAVGAAQRRIAIS